MARIPVEVDYGSEFRYRRPVVNDRTLTIGISQSGETADTVAALSEARRAGSPIARDRQRARAARSPAWPTRVFPTHAGPEIGVASTKAFTTQLAVLFLLAAKLRESRGLGPGSRPEERHALAHLPRAVGETLATGAGDRGARPALPARTRLPLPRPRPALPGGARGRAEAQGDLLHPRRGLSGGEMKHGPIALVDENMPVVVLAPARRLAREDALEPARGQVARRHRDRRRDAPGRRGRRRSPTTSSSFPRRSRSSSRSSRSIPLQLFAYHVAVRRGCDVDQPRNLAKSVTVE